MRSCKTNAGWTPLVTPLPPAASRRGRRLPAQRRLQVHWDRARAGRKKCALKTKAKTQADLHLPALSVDMAAVHETVSRETMLSALCAVPEAAGRGPHIYGVLASLYIYIYMPSASRWEAHTVTRLHGSPELPDAFFFFLLFAGEACGTACDVAFAGSSVTMRNGGRDATFDGVRRRRATTK